MKQLEQTITSMEVAEMVEKRHCDLMRDINRYCKQMTKANEENTGERKIALSDFFKESTYKNSQNKTQPCYDITKKGCEFIAHKLTGVKGTTFTAQYINRFHTMEEALQQPPLPESSPNWYELDITPPKVPIFKSWYKRNKGRIYRLCKRGNIELNVLYHYILVRIGERYDLEAANAIYEQETGHAPTYAMDIVEYFPELGKEADWLLDRLENL